MKSSRILAKQPHPRSLGNEAEHLGSSAPRGMSLIEVLVVIGILGLLIALIVPAVQASREASRRITCVNNLHQIGVGMQTYHSNFDVFPSDLFGWHVQLLPYLDQKNLYGLTEGGSFLYLSPDKLAELAKHSVPNYICPSDYRVTSGSGLIFNYRMCAGDGVHENGVSVKGPAGVDGGDSLSPVGARDIVDGLSQTVAIAERLTVDPQPIDSLPATHPELGLQIIRRAGTAYFTPDQLDAFAKECDATPLPATEWIGEPCNELTCFDYNHVLPPNHWSCCSNTGGTQVFQARTATSQHRGGVNILLADGSVRFVSQSVDPKVWRSLGTRNGREPIAGNY